MKTLKSIIMAALCAVGFVAFADGSGTPDDPWLIGSPNAADVIAYTSQTFSAGNKLYVKGIGAMKDFPKGAPWASPGNPIDAMQIITDADSRVTTIGASAFAGCACLSNVRFPKLVYVTAIGASAFAGCTNLYSFTILDTVETIGASAFAGCPLSSVEIPVSVKTIGASAFKDCDNLTTVTVRAVVPPSLGMDAISTVGLQAIYVPEAGLAAYRQADGWKEYASYFKPVYDLTVLRKVAIKEPHIYADPITMSTVTNWVDRIREDPAENGYSWSTDAGGKPLLTITEPGLIVVGTTAATSEHILLNTTNVTLRNINMNVAANCVVASAAGLTALNVEGRVELRANGAQNAGIIASNGGSLVISNGGKLVVRSNGEVSAIRADGGILINKPGRLDCRAEQASAIGTKGRLTIASMSAEAVLRGFKSGVCGALEAAQGLVLPSEEGWGVYGSTDMAAPTTDLFDRVTVGKPSGSGVYTGCIGDDFAKVVTFARLAEVKDSADLFDWGVESMSFSSLATPHGKFLEASADAMIAAYTARIAKDDTDYEAYICRALAYLKKAGENQAFFDLAQEFGYVFDNDTMHFTGELVHEKGVTPEMNDATAVVCDILLPLMKQAYADLSAIPYNWKGDVAITPDVYPVDEAVYFDYADVLMAKAGLAEMLCVLNMVKGFDMTMDSDLLEYTFNSRSPKNGKRGVQPILENNPDFFSKVRDQKAATEAGDWWASAATLLDQWDKAHAKRPYIDPNVRYKSREKPHFFDWDFEHLDHKGVTSVAWLRKHRVGLINMPYWASPFDWTLMNGDQNQFWTLQPLFAGKFLREHFPEFGVGVKEPWCNEPLLDTLPDPTFCGIWPGVSRTYIGALMTEVARAGDFTSLPPYTPDSASSVHAIWYDNMFELGFDNTGNQSIFAWESQSPLVLLDPEFNVRGVTAVFTGWSFSGYPNGSKSEWEGSAIPTPYTKESPMYKRRNVVATANFTIPQVTYLDFEGGKLAERTDECELVKAETATFEAGKVYAVPVDVTLKHITVNGTPQSPAKLVLCDGVTLAVTNGIEVAAGSALVICGQALGTGILEATGSSGTAGIGGGGDVTINGGTVIATGGSSGSGIGGGTVTINAGTVTAAGRDGAAGIGGTVTFGAGIAYGVAAGADEANALYKTAAAFTADHSAAYVALPYFSLKIPEATEGCSYEVSCAGVESKAALAGGVNTYAIATGATARVRFTLGGDDYIWEKAPDDNPMIIANISGDTVVAAADLPTVKYAPKGSADNPWTVGAPNADDVIAYTNGVGELVVEGSGDMKDFDPSSDPAPWGKDITEVEIVDGVTGIGANAFNDSRLGSATIPASVTNIGAAAFFCSTSLSNVTVEAMTPPALGDGAFVEVAEGYKIAVPQGTGAAYKAAPDWSLYADSIFEQGTPECPWQVGTPKASDVTAYTDGEGKLVVGGTGNMKDFDPSSHPAPWGTGVTEVEIGEDVTGIGAKAFAGCASLSNVTVKAKTPPALGADALADTAEDLKIVVPFGTGAAYKAAPGWSDFADSIVEPGSPEYPWTVGDGVTAYIDENGTLHVEGEGDMKDFTAEDPAPWGASAADIKSIEIGEGVTKVGNCAFIDCSIDAPNTFTVDDEDFELNLLAFVSADKTATNALATGVFRVVSSETGKAEPVVAFGPKDSTTFSFSIERSLRHADWTTVQLLTLNAAQEREYGYLVSLAGETPYSKSMQKLLDDANAALANATTYNEIAQVEGMYKSQIEAQAEKDKRHEIEGTDITWRTLDGTLVIEGAGDMPDFDPSSDPAPWGKGITEVEIGDGVTGIGANAFNDSQLGSATIPASVTNIGAAAFFCSTSLSNVVVEAMTPPALGEGAFVEVAEGYKIAVPMGTSAAYKAAPDWSLYADHIFEQGSPECPWEIGEGVEAYLNDTELVIQGTGTITDLSEIPDSVKDGLTAITITTSDVTGAANDAFAGFDGIALTLPEGWQGDRPDAGGNWYGATGVAIAGSEDCPWTIGEGVTAYTNGTELVISGTGTITDLSKIPDDIKSGIDGITITTSDVTGAASDAFAGFDDIALTLPAGWQGDRPDAGGNWYGATGAAIAGSEDCPWTIGTDGETPPQNVTAHTNGTELVIGGAGTISDFAKIPDDVKSGIDAITITTSDVTGAAEDAFASIGGEGDVAVTLPDGWQGELPDEDGNWYGMTGVTLTRVPLAVKNVKFLQRYPWNGLVDIKCDVSGAGTVTLKVTTLTNDVTFVANPTLTGETTIDLDAVGGATNGVKFVWNAANDLPAGFKAGGVKVKVTAER